MDESQAETAWQAWITFNTRNGGMTRYADNSNERDVFDAGFAAASEGGRPALTATDLPDAVVEAAAREIQRVIEGWMNYDDEDWTLLARAALAAASGPWAEHLDAEAEPCGMPHPSHPEWLCDRPKGHDAHRRPGDVWRTDEDAWVAMVAERDAALARNAELERDVRNVTDWAMTREKERDALRAELDNLKEEVSGYVFESIPLIAQQRDTAEAELDNLRETLAQKIEAHMRSEQIRVPEYETGLRRAAALVRGSDDEAETNTDLICKCGRNIPCRHCPEESPTQTVTKRPGKGSL